MWDSLSFSSKLITPEKQQWLHATLPEAVPEVVDTLIIKMNSKIITRFASGTSIGD